MKPNQHQTSRPVQAVARIVVILALGLWLGSPTSVRAQAVPGYMNYQGILLNGQGAPITTPTDVQFRIWDSASLTDTNGLKWGRMFRITPDTNGAFNVVLSQEGAAVSDAPDVSLSGVFTSVGSDSRYLELTVAGSTAIRPRQRFVASPYAMLASDLTPRLSFAVNGPLTVSGAANVNSLTTPNGVSATTVSASTVSASTVTAGTVTATNAVAAALTVSGAANVGPLTVNGTATASNFAGNGAGLTNLDASRISSGILNDARIPATLTGDKTFPGKVSIGTSAAPQANFEVVGTVRMMGSPQVIGGWIPPESNTDWSMTGTNLQSDGFLSVTVTLQGSHWNSTDVYVWGEVDGVICGAASVLGMSGVDNPSWMNSFTMPIRRGGTWKISRHTQVSGYLGQPGITNVFTPLGR